MRTVHRTLTMRRNFVWSFGGNATYNAAQWLLIVALARLANPTIVGQFALILAITAPVFLCVGLNLKVVQATDSAQVWRLSDYIRVCHLTNAVSITVSMLVGLALGLRGGSFLALAAVTGAKSAEALCQTFYGYFQNHERLDLQARSLLLRAVSGTVLFVGAYVAWRHLALACVGLFVGWAATLLFQDRRIAHAMMASDARPSPSADASWRHLWRLVRKAAPLGVDAGLSSLAMNVPRYMVSVLLNTAALGLFASLAYFAQVISMVTGAMGETVVPRLAKYHHNSQRRAFANLLGKLTLFGLGVAVATVCGALLVGAPFIRLTLGPEYVDIPLLIILMASGGCITIQRCLGRGLQAAQRYGAYLLSDVVIVPVIAIGCVIMIPMFGLDGAALATCAGFVAGIVTVIIQLIGTVRAMPRTPTFVQAQA